MLCLEQTWAVPTVSLFLNRTYVYAIRGGGGGRAAPNAAGCTARIATAALVIHALHKVVVSSVAIYGVSTLYCWSAFKANLAISSEQVWRLQEHTFNTDKKPAVHTFIGDYGSD